VRPDAYLVGEIWETAPEWVAGDRFDALMNYPLAEAILGYVGGSRLDMAAVNGHHEYRRHLRPLDGPAFARRLVELLGVYDPDVVAVQLNLIGSHDAPRAQTVLGGDTAALRMATLLQCMLPGAPCIYYGDEIGLTGGNDPGCRGAFPWDPARWDGDLRAFVRSVLAFRAAEPALRHGATSAIGSAGAAMAIERRLDGARLVLALNPGDGATELDVALEGLGSGRLEPALSTESSGAMPDPIAIVDGRARVAIPSRSAIALRVAVDAA
jgi:neopullulanase